MIRINQLKLSVNHSSEELASKIFKTLRLNRFMDFNADDLEYSIKRRSIDARNKPDLYYIYTVSVRLNKNIEKNILKNNRNKDIGIDDEVIYKDSISCGSLALNKRPVIIGSGPAGLFCAFLLAKSGYRPIVIERGECVEDRTKTVEDFFNTNILNTESNVQFGEGGAGTFSDGKLNTLVKDKLGRNKYVLQTFIRYGAKESIAYDAKPHLGTDELSRIVKNMRQGIIELGGEFRFNTRLQDIVVKDDIITGIKVCNTKGDNTDELTCIDTDVLILATGHSARDTFEMLYRNKLMMVQKNFAVGLRMEHPQSLINKIQYGNEKPKGVGAADYKVTNQASNGRSVYSFCMCPGGYVVNASSENGRLAVNGMSYSGRDSDNANSAIIVSVDAKDYGSDEPLAGMYFQRRLEEKAYKLGKGNIPVQRYADYKENITTKELNGLKPCVKGDYTLTNLRELFNTDINDAIIESVEKFGYTMKGFAMDDALLLGVESRTSSPVRIIRDENMEANIKGIYPCGEGAGYAGGITSAAMDGLRIAEQIISTYYPEYREAQNEKR